MGADSPEEVGGAAWRGRGAMSVAAGAAGEPPQRCETGKRCEGKLGDPSTAASPPLRMTDVGGLGAGEWLWCEGEGKIFQLALTGSLRMTGGIRTRVRIRPGFL